MWSEFMFLRRCGWVGKKRVALVAEAVDCCVVWIRFEFMGRLGVSLGPAGFESGSGNQSKPHSNIILRIKTPTTQAT